MRKLFAVLALAALVGCAGGLSGTATSPQQAVYAAKGNYEVALRVAVAYKALPRCGQAISPVLCAKADVVATLQKVDTASSALLDAAENTVRAPGAGANAQTAIKAAEQAVAAFTTITQALAVK